MISNHAVIVYQPKPNSSLVVDYCHLRYDVEHGQFRRHTSRLNGVVASFKQPVAVLQFNSAESLCGQFSSNSSGAQPSEPLVFSTLHVWDAGVSLLPSYANLGKLYTRLDLTGAVLMPYTSFMDDPVQSIAVPKLSLYGNIHGSLRVSVVTGQKPLDWFAAAEDAMVSKYGMKRSGFEPSFDYVQLRNALKEKGLDTSEMKDKDVANIAACVFHRKQLQRYFSTASAATKPLPPVTTGQALSFLNSLEKSYSSATQNPSDKPIIQGGVGKVVVSDTTAKPSTAAAASSNSGL